MSYSDKLNLDSFFWAARDQDYVVIKAPDFSPDYHEGGDIDIICKDKNEFSRKIIEVGNQYVDEGFEMRVSIKEEMERAYIDFYKDNKLEFRFDIYASVQSFKKIRLKKEYLDTLLKNKTKIARGYNGIKYSVYIPSEIDDLLLKYVEYVEWAEERPDKIRHLKFIASKISSDKTKLSFLDRLHSFLDSSYVEQKEGKSKEKGPGLKPRLKQRASRMKKGLKLKLYKLTKKLRVYNLYKKIKSKT